MITLKPVGGLGNRMKVLSSAISLQKDRGDQLSIIWDQSHVLNCPFDSLFVIPNDVSVKNIKYGKIRRVRRMIYRFLKLKHVEALRYDLILDNHAVFKKRYQGSEIADYRKVKDIYIETYEAFYKVGQMNFFDFNPEVMVKADSISRQFSESTIGIHIRRGDHPTARKESPMHAFIRIMEDEIERNDHVSFFLATDSEGAEVKLRGKFENRIHFNDQKVNNRTSREGVMDALVDMLCLSRTKKSMVATTVHFHGSHQKSVIFRL